MSDQQQFLHSTYRKIDRHDGTKTDALMVCSKDVVTGETKFTTHVDPKRPMWVVRKGLRNNFSMMKEAHHLRDLEEYQVYNHELEHKLAKALDIYLHPKFPDYISQPKVLNSPYSAGNDIPIDVLFKHQMNDNLERTADSYRVGALDIETDVVHGSGAILCVAYVSDDHEVFLSILRSFLKGNEDIDKIKACCHEKIGEFASSLNKKAKKVMEKHPVKTINIKICETEMDQLKWIWKKVHEKKDEVLSIWNMIFDMGVMLKRMGLFGANPADIMCHPEAPNKYRVCNLKEDKTPIEKLGHHTYRWDVMELSGYTQPIDSMCLFSRLRKVKGLLGSYSLGNIASDIIGSTKMDFGDDGHYTMQSERPVEYCAYNIIDSLILTVMDKVTNDVGSMFLLTQNSVIPAFAKQTVQLTHSFYKYLKDKDMVPGSCKGLLALTMDTSTGIIMPYASWLSKYKPNDMRDMIKEGKMVDVDDKINNTGGGVLNPLLTHKTGVPLLEETDNETNVAMAVSDLDVALCVSTIIE